MQWLDRLIDKWNAMMDKLRPAMETISYYCHRIGKTLSTFWHYLYMLRSVILAAPVAAAAVIIASISMKRLPETVSIIGFGIDRSDPDAIFGFLTIFEKSISCEMAVIGPLVLTALCLVMMLLSKRTLYPFLISLMTLLLPLFIWFYNTYPM